jgi:hypothetical protein
LGHLLFLPANWSLREKGFKHLGHLKAIMVDSPKVVNRSLPQPSERAGHARVDVGLQLGLKLSSRG